MTLRHALALLILMPVCASGLASPIGALTGPFAVHVLAQQREVAAQDNAAPQKPDQADATGQRERETKRGVSDTAGKPHCQTAVIEELVLRSRGSLDPLPEPGHRSSGN